MAKMRYLTATQSRIFIVAGIIAFLFIALISFLAVDTEVDDAFIVYRYVDRLLAQKGLTYNDGEYVEGFTSLLWTLILAVCSFTFKARPHIVAVWMNYAFILSSAISMLWLLKILRVNNLLKVASLFLFGISVLYFKVVYFGLEFGLFALLLILFFCFFLASLDYPNYKKMARKDSFLTGFLAVGLFATRPESAVLLPALLLIVYLSQRHNQKIKTALIYSGCSFVIFLIPIITWRLIYFGELLPNSIIAKSIPFDSLFSETAPFSRKKLIGMGFDYIIEAYKFNPSLVFTTILAGLAAVKKIRTLELSLLYFPILWQHIIIIINGGDWMEFSRFITMFVPLFIIILILLLEAFGKESKTISVAGLLIFSSLYLYTNIPYLILTAQHLEGSLGKYDSYQIVGQALNDVWLEKDILTPEAIGRIAYFMPNALIRDPAGLTDKVLAHDQTAIRTVFGRGNWYYSLTLEPSIIILHYWPHQVSWATFGLGYPEQFAFYCLPPHPKAKEQQWLLIIVRLDKVSRYSPPLVELGAQQLAYESLATLGQSDNLVCNTDTVFSDNFHSFE
jgi:hypothetical protein